MPFQGCVATPPGKHARDVLRAMTHDVTASQSSIASVGSSGSGSNVTGCGGGYASGGRDEAPYSPTGGHRGSSQFPSNPASNHRTLPSKLVAVSPPVVPLYESASCNDLVRGQRQMTATSTSTSSSCSSSGGTGGGSRGGGRWDHQSLLPIQLVHAETLRLHSGNW